MSQATEKPSEISLVEFDSNALLQVDPASLTNEQLIEMIKKLQNLRAGPHELAREKKKNVKKTAGTYIDPMEGL